MAIYLPQQSHHRCTQNQRNQHTEDDFFCITNSFRRSDIFLRLRNFRTTQLNMKPTTRKHLIAQLSIGYQPKHRQQRQSPQSNRLRKSCIIEKQTQTHHHEPSPHHIISLRHILWTMFFVIEEYAYQHKYCHHSGLQTIQMHLTCMRHSKKPHHTSQHKKPQNKTISLYTTIGIDFVRANQQEKSHQQHHRKQQSQEVHHIRRKE